MKWSSLPLVNKMTGEYNDLKRRLETLEKTDPKDFFITVNTKHFAVSLDLDTKDVIKQAVIANVRRDLKRVQNDLTQLGVDITK